MDTFVHLLALHFRLVRSAPCYHHPQRAQAWETLGSRRRWRWGQMLKDRSYQNQRLLCWKHTGLVYGRTAALPRNSRALRVTSASSSKGHSLFWDMDCRASKTSTVVAESIQSVWHKAGKWKLNSLSFAGERDLLPYWPCTPWPLTFLFSALHKEILDLLEPRGEAVSTSTPNENHLPILPSESP